MLTLPGKQEVENKPICSTRDSAAERGRRQKVFTHFFIGRGCVGFRGCYFLYDHKSLSLENQLHE